MIFFKCFPNGKNTAVISLTFMIFRDREQTDIRPINLIRQAEKTGDADHTYIRLNIKSIHIKHPQKVLL